LYRVEEGETDNTMQHVAAQHVAWCCRVLKTVRMGKDIVENQQCRRIG